MSRRSSLFGSAVAQLGEVAIGLIVLVLGATVLSYLLTDWTRLLSGEAIQKLFLVPESVLTGQVWRLITYPVIDPGSPLNLFFDIWGLAIFVPPLEESWGTRRLLKRMAVLVVVPAVLTVLLSLGVRSLGIQYPGPQALITACVVAFACELRGREITLIPLPFRFSGDGLLWLEAGVLAIVIIIGRTIFPYMNMVFSFGFAVVWFRFNVARDLRRSWLQLRKRRIEGRMAKLRRERNLRLVGSDDEDDEEPKRFLH